MQPSVGWCLAGIMCRTPGSQLRGILRGDESAETTKHDFGCSAAPLKAWRDSSSFSTHLPTPGHLQAQRGAGWEGLKLRRLGQLQQNAAQRRSSVQNTRFSGSLDNSSKLPGCRQRHSNDSNTSCCEARPGSLAGADGAGVLPLAQLKGGCRVGGALAQLHDVRQPLALRAVPADRSNGDGAAADECVEA